MPDTVVLARVAFAVAWIGVQAALVSTAGNRPDAAFGFRMFSESSTIEAHLTRTVVRGGRTVELPVEDGTWTTRDSTGRGHNCSWHDRVKEPILAVFDRTIPASYSAVRAGHPLASRSRRRRRAPRAGRRDPRPEPHAHRPPQRARRRRHPHRGARSSRRDRPGLRRWALELGDTYVLGLVRALIGLFLFWHALVLGQDLSQHGYFGDAFHLPILPESWVLPLRWYATLAGVRVILAVMVTVGHRARYALFFSALLSVYVMLCDRIQLHHNRFALACYAFLLAFTPCDRSFKITAPEETSASSRIGPLWAQRLVQLQCCLVYLASGGAKLLDPDWRDGSVLGDRFVRYGYQAESFGVPAALIQLFQQPFATGLLAKLAIATELFLAFALLSKRTRDLRAVVGDDVPPDHPGDQQGGDLHLADACRSTRSSATPDTLARRLSFDPDNPRAVYTARFVALLDWLARFDIQPWKPDQLKQGHALVITRRDGTHATGLAAFAMCTRCLPLLFPLWAPVAFLASFTRKGETSETA